MDTIIEELRKFNIKPAVEEIQKWFSGESGLNSQNIKEIMNVWVERFYPESSAIDIDADDDVWLELHTMAHEKDITLNHLITLALEEQIERTEKE